MPLISRAVGFAIAFARDIGRGSVNGFEDRDALADISARHHAQPADQSRREVAHDVAVKIRQQQHVELLRIEHHLHAGVVDDQFLVFDVRILRGHFARVDVKKSPSDSFMMLAL